MTTRSYLKLATVSIFALGMAFSAAPANAQTVFESATPETININAVVQNAISATVVEPDAGTLGVLASTAPGEAAQLTIDPDGTIDTANAIDGESRIVSDGSALPGSITVAAGDAFNDTAIYITYETGVDLNCAVCVASEDIELIEVTDDLNLAPGTACPATTAVAAVLDVDTPTSTQGCGTTSATGELVVNIGYTIATVDGNATRPVYEDGVYVGTFDAIVEY
jgi:hypothetical protein